MSGCRGRVPPSGGQGRPSAFLSLWLCPACPHLSPHAALPACVRAGSSHPGQRPRDLALLALVLEGPVMRFVTHHARGDVIPPHLRLRETRVEGGPPLTGPGVPEVGCVVGETEAGVCTCSCQDRAWALMTAARPPSSLCEAQHPPAGSRRSRLRAGFTRGQELKQLSGPPLTIGCPLPWEACALRRGPLFHREDPQGAERRELSAGKSAPRSRRGSGRQVAST